MCFNIVLGAACMEKEANDSQCSLFETFITQAPQEIVMKILFCDEKSWESRVSVLEKLSVFKKFSRTLNAFLTLDKIAKLALCTKEEINKQDADNQIFVPLCRSRSISQRLLNYLISGLVDIKKEGGIGHQLLCYAVFLGNNLTTDPALSTQLVSRLITAGIDVNQKNCEKRTLLWDLVNNGHPAYHQDSKTSSYIHRLGLIKMLLARGADFSLADTYSIAPIDRLLYIPYSDENKEVLHLLLKQGAKFSTQKQGSFWRATGSFLQAAYILTPYARKFEKILGLKEKNPLFDKDFKARDYVEQFSRTELVLLLHAAYNSSAFAKIYADLLELKPADLDIDALEALTEEQKIMRALDERKKRNQRTLQ